MIGAAAALLQAGIDLSLIRDYLGHASVGTISRYLRTNLKMKRDVLRAFGKRAGLMKAGRHSRASPKLIAFLESLWIASFIWSRKDGLTASGRPSEAMFQRELWIIPLSRS